MTDLAEARKALGSVISMHKESCTGEWVLATSCSWRRIINARGESVIVPCNDHSDNHPNLDCGIEYINALLAVEAVNAFAKYGPAILQCLQAAEQAQALREQGELPKVSAW